MNSHNKDEIRNSNSKINSYRDLKVWQTSVNLVTDIYRKTNSFPKNELYGLTS